MTAIDILEALGGDSLTGETPEDQSIRIEQNTHQMKAYLCIMNSHGYPSELAPLTLTSEVIANTQAESYFEKHLATKHAYANIKSLLAKLFELLNRSNSISMMKLTSESDDALAALPFYDRLVKGAQLGRVFIEGLTTPKNYWAIRKLVAEGSNRITAQVLTVDGGAPIWLPVSLDTVASAPFRENMANVSQMTLDEYIGKKFGIKSLKSLKSGAH